MAYLGLQIGRLFCSIAVDVGTCNRLQKGSHHAQNTCRNAHFGAACGDGCVFSAAPEAGPASSSSPADAPRPCTATVSECATTTDASGATATVSAGTSVSQPPGRPEFPDALGYIIAPALFADACRQRLFLGFSLFPKLLLRWFRWFPSSSLGTSHLTPHSHLPSRRLSKSMTPGLPGSLISEASSQLTVLMTSEPNSADQKPWT